MSQKIVSLNKLAQIIENLKSTQKTVVHCHGVFDLVHPGHLKHFEDAQKLGDILIVTISPDHFVNKGPGRPVFNQRLRLEHLAALEMVDYVAVNLTSSASETILHLKPNIYVKGKEYDSLQDLTGNVLLEKKAIESIGGQIVFIGDTVYSSTQLLNDYFNVFSPKAENYLKSLRKFYNADSVISKIDELKNKTVAVIGEVIIDEYCFCQPVGLANKSVTINTRYLRSETHLGGAGAVANHIAAFCNKVHLISCLGEKNNYQSFVDKKLLPNVSKKLFKFKNSVTNVKRRFLDNDYNRLFELSFLNEQIMNPKDEVEIINYLESILNEFDIVIIADYGHGFLSTKNITDLLCSTKSYLAINTQTNSSNKGFNLATKYSRANYFCLDRVELQLAIQNQNETINQSIIQLSRKISVDLIAVTLGGKGSIIWNQDNNFCEAIALTSETIDATGAGDAYFAMTALSASCGYSPNLVSFLGNCAGAMMVRLLGNQTSINLSNFKKIITALLK